MYMHVEVRGQWAKSTLSFQHVDPGDQPEVVRLGKHAPLPTEPYHLLLKKKMLIET